MNDLGRQARVTAFLRKSLAGGAQDVLTLEAMARTEGLLGDRQRITHARPFKRGKHSLRIRSVRAGFGTNGGWRWQLPCDRANQGVDTRSLQHYLGHKNIQHTVRYSELSPERFRDFWKGQRGTHNTRLTRGGREKSKNPQHPAVKREAEENWGKKKWR